MLRFSLLSEVVMVASADQAPCRIPPSAFTVMPFWDAAYTSRLVELNLR